jgi:MoaA/NifB/PqqE/SkfB family radical SAM enzyme
MPSVATLDFHLTSRCKQSCPYCASPELTAEEMDTQRAAAIVRKARALGIPRLVFTGGDPLLRPDAGLLLRLARQERLEAELATPGDKLTPGFLRAYGRWIDRLSLPLDAPNEAISSLTKNPGHFDATLRHLKLLSGFPRIDLKITTAVTRRNRDAVPELLTLFDQMAPTLPNRLALDIHQVHPRGTAEVAWRDLVVTDEAFASLRAADEGRPHPYRVNWLDRRATDGLRLTVLPDGRLSVFADGQVHDLGPFVEIRDLEAALAGSGFDAPRHLQHAQAWSSLRREEALGTQSETVAQ